MKRYLSLLSAALKDELTSRNVILLLDMAPCHLHSSFRAHAKKCQVQLLYIPVHLTRVLQPADTHLFAQFKAKFASLYREKKSVVDNGAVSPHVWLEVLCTTLKTLSPSVKWKLAFAKVGVLNRQRELSARTLSELGSEALPAICEGPSNEVEVRRLFPINRNLDVMSYVACGLELTIFC